MDKKRVLIMGAAGRDFHDFNVFYRDKEEYEVVAFTATQIPNIDDRKYPAELAGKFYPDGIPIYSENGLTDFIKDQKIDEVVFSYSDVSHEYVMHKASRVQAAGAKFVIMGAKQTMLKSTVPVIAVCAIRTGCGKSAVTREICRLLKELGKRAVAIRHPMPYGDLVKQSVQRFETYDDLLKHECTIEEMEEYEPHIDDGTVVYAGVDYEAILREAEKESDIILWDGGNNDLPFYKPDLHITLVDPHRPGHEQTYFPGESNVILADVVIISKEDSANAGDISKVKESVNNLNPNASVIDALLNITIEDAGMIRGRKVLAVEDGPTVTHGGMPYGAAVLAAKKHGCAELVDPRPFAVGGIKDTFKKYPGIGTLLPAMGYGEQQIKDLEETIDNAECDIVVLGTPIDLSKRIKISKPVIRAKYEYGELSSSVLKEFITKFAK